MEKDHKPQWVRRMLMFFKAVPEGRPVDGRLLVNVRYWKTADLHEELFLSPEKSQNTTKWTAGTLLEAFIAPMDGLQGSGDPPIPTILSNYAESLWGFGYRQWRFMKNVACTSQVGRRRLRSRRRWGVHLETLGTLRCRLKK